MTSPTPPKVEVFEAPPTDFLRPTSTREVWVQVQSDELLDLPSILELLDDDQASLVSEVRTKAHSLSYYPSLNAGEYRFEDWYVYSVVVDGKAVVSSVIE